MELSDLVEIKTVFEERDYLDCIFQKLLINGKISGYQIIENKTIHYWDGEIEEKTNYIAKTLIEKRQVKEISDYLDSAIKEKWDLPLIQISECQVNKEFYEYMTDLN